MISKIVRTFSIIFLLVSCSTTSQLPAGEQLYIGLDHVTYENYEKNDHATATKEEVDAVLACQPNGALFGSSFHRTPLPYGLWIWNAFSDSESGLGKWLAKSFGKPPVLMSTVNPALRSTVAQSVLRAHGYFRGKVNHETLQMKNPKKGKIGYNIDMGHLFTLDSIAYINFPPAAEELIALSESDRKIKSGDAFDVSMLDAERTRLSNLFRNNGYYYYEPGYASYLADTLSVPGKVQLKLQMADSLPSAALKKWYIGKVDVQLRKQFMKRLNDSIQRRRFTVHFNGRRPPVRAGVLLGALKLRPGQLYSYDNYLESVSKLSTTGLFSMVDFRFTPRDTTLIGDTLDMQVTTVFDKPYDFYIEGNMTGKTNGLVGPELILGLTKRNVFRGGEKLDFNIHGSYEWQTGHDAEGTSSDINSWEYGGDISLEYPRLLIPRFGKKNIDGRRRGPQIHRRRFYSSSSTLIKASLNIVNRAKYFRRHIISGEFTYNFQTSETSRHSFSPLILSYNYMNRTTARFDTILQESPYLKMAMMDQFIPKMNYTYFYNSPQNLRNPIRWEISVSESANILSLGYLIAGKKWGEKEKTMFQNPYAQFFKIETDFRKTWELGKYSELVGHLNAGIIFSYGNSFMAPYSEQFYVGGANSVRAFNVRTIGPGSYYVPIRKYSYMDQTGDIKLQGNLEYRSRLFGNLHGAVFIDAGNVWTRHNDDYRPGGRMKLKSLLDQLAVGTGVGLRYDLDFFVLRLDWGIGIHLPYDTGKNGYYNIPKFKDGQSIHLAIGYPF